jgi:hypothetical protein
MQPPLGQPPGAVPARNRTTLYGWLGIVLGLLCCGLLGILFGVLSIQQAKRTGQAATLGYIAIALSVVNMVVGGILGATGNYPGRS